MADLLSLGKSFREKFPENIMLKGDNPNQEASRNGLSGFQTCDYIICMWWESTREMLQNQRYWTWAHLKTEPYNQPSESEDGFTSIFHPCESTFRFPGIMTGFPSPSLHFGRSSKAGGFLVVQEKFSEFKTFILLGYRSPNLHLTQSPLKKSIPWSIYAGENSKHANKQIWIVSPAYVNLQRKTGSSFGWILDEVWSICNKRLVQMLTAS